MPSRMLRFAVLLAAVAMSGQPAAHAQGPVPPLHGGAGADRRAEVLAAIPMGRLTPAARQRISSVTSHPTLYRHLTQQTIQCDPDLLLCVVRHPEVLVGIWELMEITQVQTRRLGPYQLQAVDGSGTHCTVDLVYGDSSTHVFVADGYYDGKLAPNTVHGKGVFILRTRYRNDVSGNPVVEGTLDCFVQVDSVAADLVVRTFGGLIGRTADNNFAETARFLDQLGLSAQSNPAGLEDLATRLPQVSETTRAQFAAAIRQAAHRHRAARAAARDEPSLAR